MNYQRVVPRDFFNEANLLKCLGKLELIINHTGHRIAGKLESQFDNESFDIQQNNDDGSIFVLNYTVTLNGVIVHLYCPLNSRESWPLMADFQGETYYVFDKEGNLMTNFGSGEK